MIFKTDVRVRYSETDLAGWVYYGNYFVYFEVARSAMYHQLGHDYTFLKEKGIVLPIVAAHCEYKYPAQYDDVLEVQASVVEVGERSVKTEYAVYNKKGRVLHAAGYCVQACVKNGKSQPFPKELKQAFLRAMDQDQGKAD